MNESIELFRFANLAAAPRLVHAISGRTGGVSNDPFRSLNVSTAVGDEREAVLENRRRLAAALGIAPNRLLKPGQVHGTNCLVVGKAEVEEHYERWQTSPPLADGLLTAEPEVYLFMTFGDCVPILLHDPVRGVVGLVHAGWKGTVNRAAAQALLTAQNELGCRPEDVLVGIGPSIGPCCYEVGPDVAEAALSAFPGAEGLLMRVNGRVHLDLWRANAYQLMELGVPAENIEIGGVCTSCHVDRFFSHRREKGKSGRMAAVIGMREWTD